MFDSALGPGGWHTEYHMGVRPYTTGIGRRRCVPNTPAGGPWARHAQPHARRSVPIPQPVPYPPQPRKAVEGRRGVSVSSVHGALCTAGFRWRARGEMRE